MQRLCWALCAVVAACGPSGVPGGPGIAGGPVPPPAGRPTGLSATGTIDATGGSLSLATPDGASLTVTVPSGAVQAPTAFTIDQITTDPAALLGAVGSGYRIGPAGTPLARVLTYSFVPPTGVSSTGLTAAYRNSLGYWLRVYSSTASATAVTVTTTSLGDWSLVTAATQRDLHGTFSLSSTEGVNFSASGSVTLQFLGGDATSGQYLPQGTITLTTPVTAPSGATCTTASPTLNLPVSLAELLSGQFFRWGLNGQWNLSCSNGTGAFVSTNFDTLGITNIGCLRSYQGIPTFSTTLVQGTYLIDCGTAGTVTASWTLTNP